MGIGSFLSKYINKDLVLTFIKVEILIGLVGGASAATLFMFFDHVESFRILLYCIVSIIGILIGLEVPLLMRILKERLEFKDLVSQVFTFDYVGALIASLLFPMVLVPYLGLIRSCFLFGILNVLVAIWTIRLFKEDLPWLKTLISAAVAAAAVLVSGFVLSDKLMTMGNHQRFRIRLFSRLRRTTSASSSQATEKICACSSTATCSSALAMNIATTKRWCIQLCQH